MARAKRSRLAIEADRRNREQSARIGGDLKRQRIRAHRTQDQVSARAGVSRNLVSRIERGQGATASFDAWQRVALAGREPPPEPGLIWCDLRSSRLFEWRKPA